MTARTTALRAGATLALLVLFAWLSQLPGQASLQVAADAAAQARWDDALRALEPPAPAVRSGVALRDDGVLHALRGDPPGALAAWRAARLTLPRDPDLVHDLAVVRAQLGKDVPDPVGPPRAWMEIVSPLELGLLALVAWITASVLAWRAHRGDGHGRTAIAAAVLAAALAAPAIDGCLVMVSTGIGVTRDEAPVREVPDLYAAEHHLLPAGAEVRVLSARGDFVLVEDGRGRRGWVVSGAVAQAPR